MSELAAELKAEISRLEAEESATQTKAEKAAAAAVPSPAAPAEAPSPEALLSAIDALPVEDLAGLSLELFDVAAVRVIAWRTGAELDATSARWALTPAEKARITPYAAKVLALYLPDMKVHPVTALAAVLAGTYASKALPVGGLTGLLGGKAQEASSTGASHTPHEPTAGPAVPPQNAAEPAPRVEAVTPADLVAEATAPADDVLALVEKARADLAAKKAKAA